VPGLAAGHAKQLNAFAAFMDEHEAMVAEEVPADAILTSVLQRVGLSGRSARVERPQDETRLENLVELMTVAREFVSGAAVPGRGGWTRGLDEVDAFGVPTDTGRERARRRG
jgi:DNA helicase-2/ATP-dependent DNA helicase PcrA